MSFSARLGDIAIPSGSHAAFPPTVSTGASPNVFSNGIAVVRKGDSYAPHILGSATHSPVQDTCSGTVFANDLQTARLGDKTDCGGIIGLSSTDVIIGD